MSILEANFSLARWPYSREEERGQRPGNSVWTDLEGAVVYWGMAKTLFCWRQADRNAKPHRHCLTG